MELQGIRRCGWNRWFGTLIVVSGLVLGWSLALLGATPTVQVILPSGNVAIYEQVLCQVEVTGGSGTPTGTVTFSDGAANGYFPFGDTATLNQGKASVTYVPGANDAGTTTITVNYSGDATYDPGSGNGSLNVVLRPTTTVVECLTSSGSTGVLLVYETGTVNVTVSDSKSGGADFAPPGTLTISQSLSAGIVVITEVVALTQGPAGTSTAQYSYVCTALDLDGDVDTITATYNPNDGVHASSTYGYGQAIQRRETETTLTNCTATPTGCTCNVTTTEKGGLPPAAQPIDGKLLDTSEDPPDTLVDPYTGSATVTKTANIPLVVVSVQYDPADTDKIHMRSFASAQVKRDNPAWYYTGPCGDIDVQAVLYALNAAVQAANLAGLALDLAKLIVDATPDPVAVVTTVPTSDIGASAIDAAKLALDAFAFAAEVDLDLDDIPGIIEAIMGMSDFDPDNDDDGLADREEIDQAGGHYSYAAQWAGNLPPGCACPCPTDSDSDDDGLSDGDELQIYFTDPCDWDTDGDGVSDGVEVATWASADNRDHADPLSEDTDGDGISDLLEMPLGCLGVPDPHDGFVNSFDSDGDGLRDNLDAYPDLPAETTCTFPGMLYVVPVPGSGDNRELIGFELPNTDDDLPSIADPDSDGDGLYDGFEHTRLMDFLDWDGDDDGRCDGHEVLGLGPIPTDPTDIDTDDDGVLDAAELWGGNPTNPVMPDTDGDGLCDGGGPLFTPSGTGTNALCSCAVGSAGGIVDHPNPTGLGEDANGNGSWDAGETNPNMHDTDGDGVGDGVEKLGFSTSRQGMIPAADLFGRAITVTYPACGCMNPLNPDTDGDGLSDGYEDQNHDGNFDFLPSEFDHADPLPGPPIPYPTETNPCDPDTDDDGLNDHDERFQPNPTGAYPFNPTNPLDHDTDNDRIYDGPEVNWVCTAITFSNLDNDSDALIDEDPVDGLDNDGDGLFDEDDVDFFVRFVPMLDPTNRDSDSDGWIDGLDADPCNSDLIPIFLPAIGAPVDSDKDGFADEDEEIAGTHPNDPEDHPTPYCAVDLDFDGLIDDRIWLEPSVCCGVANSVAIDIDCNVLIDARVQIVKLRHAKTGDFDNDGVEDDCRYVIEYAFSNYRVLQPRIVATIDDYDCDLVIDWVVVEKK